MKALKALLLLALPLGGTALSAVGPIYPLSENSFSNPEFVKRFTGSYGFDLEKNPQISREEAELFGTIAPLMQNNPRQAITQLQTYYDAATADPEKSPSAAILYTIGSLHLTQGDNATANRFYERAIREFPNFFRAYQNLGLSLVQTGKFAEALPHLTKALEIGGGSGSLYGLIGYCHLNLGHPTSSLDAYRFALIFQPDSRDWKLGKLSGLLQSGQSREAITMLNQLIAERPDQADFWLQQANAFLGEQSYLDAAANLELVARMNQGSPQSLLLLGDLYIAEGLPSLAVDTYTKALEGQKIGAERLLQIVENLSHRNAPSEASRFLESIQRDYADVLTDAQSLLALNLEARLLLAQGERDAAVVILNQVVARDPLNGKALITLGDYHRDLGELEQATFQYENASKVEATRAEAYLALGRLKVSQREYRQAIEFLRLAQSVQPRPYVAEYIDRLEAALRSTGS